MQKIYSKKTPTQVFSCEYHKIFKYNLEEYLCMDASELLEDIFQELNQQKNFTSDSDLHQIYIKTNCIHVIA